MSDKQYTINNTLVNPKDPGWQELLSAAHQDKANRPLCMCKPEGVPMYIAMVGNKFILKRMPATGKDHAVDCDSFEFPSELSGRGALGDSVIQENEETGETHLKVDFSLTKRKSVMAENDGPVQGGLLPRTFSSEEKKLSTRGVLDFLYEKAGFNRWSHRMQGKRSWYVIQKYLQEACLSTYTKKNPLNESILIPESFSVSRKDELKKKYAEWFAKMTAKEGGDQKVGIIIGEMKSLDGNARAGGKLTIKHLSDHPFLMGQDVFKKIEKAYETELAFFREVDGIHIIAVATFTISAAGSNMIETIGLMCTTKEWIPFDSFNEKNLIDYLVSDDHHFVKCMRYNISNDEVMASCLISSQNEDPVAVYCSPAPGDNGSYGKLMEIFEESDVNSYVWDIVNNQLVGINEIASLFEESQEEEQ